MFSHLASSSVPTHHHHHQRSPSLLHRPSPSSAPPVSSGPISPSRTPAIIEKYLANIESSGNLSPNSAQRIAVSTPAFRSVKDLAKRFDVPPSSAVTMVRSHSSGRISVGSAGSSSEERIRGGIISTAASASSIIVPLQQTTEKPLGGMKKVDGEGGDDDEDAKVTEAEEPATESMTEVAPDYVLVEIEEVPGLVSPPTSPTIQSTPTPVISALPTDLLMKPSLIAAPSASSPPLHPPTTLISTDQPTTPSQEEDGDDVEKDGSLGESIEESLPTSTPAEESTPILQLQPSLPTVSAVETEDSSDDEHPGALSSTPLTGSTMTLASSVHQVEADAIKDVGGTEEVIKKKEEEVSVIQKESSSATEKPAPVVSAASFKGLPATDEASSSSAPTTRPVFSYSNILSKPAPPPLPVSIPMSTPSPVDSIDSSTQHPLSEKWRMYYSSKNKTPSQASSATYSNAGLANLFACSTVEEFCSSYKALRGLMRKVTGGDGGLGGLTVDSNFHFFTDGVEPVWEDKMNEKGGRITCTIPRAYIDNTFTDILYLLIGSIITIDCHDSTSTDEEGQILGVVASRRARGDRVEIWLGGPKEPTQAWVERVRVAFNKELGFDNGDAMVGSNSFGKYRKHF